MTSIFRKELIGFFGSLIGLMTIAVFLLVLGLMMWVLPDYSILSYQYATMDQLFTIAPALFIFLVPAITMRTFADEYSSGNFELIRTKPLSVGAIVGGKFLASLTLVILALLPTLIYVYSVSVLGSPQGNIDLGEVAGAYLGLLGLSSVFVAIGIFSSSLTSNQIVAFLIGSFMCFFFHWVFFYLSKLPLFFGKWDDLIQKIGIDYHYVSMSRGVLDTRDILYFLTMTALFVLLSMWIIERKK